MVGEIRDGGEMPGAAAVPEVGAAAVRVGLFHGRLLLGGRGFERDEETGSDLTVEVLRSLHALLSQQAAAGIRLNRLYVTGRHAGAAPAEALLAALQEELPQRLDEDFAIRQVRLARPGGDPGGFRGRLRVRTVGPGVARPLRSVAAADV